MEKYHLIYDNGEYKLKKANNQRASKVITSNKYEAIKEAKQYILDHGEGSLKIHRNKDNIIQEERTYPRSIDPKNSEG